MNARSLLPKIDELYLLCKSLNPDLVIISESWLTDTVLDEQIAIPGYGSPFRNDRSDGRRGGGVCVYVKDSFSCIPIDDSIPENSTRLYERLFLRVPGINVLILALYIPPNLAKLEKDKIVQDIAVSAEAFLSVPQYSKFLVAGDLNDFPTEDLEFQFSLNQVVSHPTRGNAILDKILLDTELLDEYNIPTVCTNFSSSDHRIVFMPSIASKPNLKRVRKLYDFRSSIHNFLQSLNAHNWSDFYRSNADLDVKVRILYERINNAMSCIPGDLVEMSPNDKPWVTPKLKLLINKRFAAYRAGEWQTFQHLKLKIRSEIQTAKRIWLEKGSSNACGLWKCVNELRNKRSNNNLTTLIQSYPSFLAAADSINTSLSENFSAPPDWSELQSMIDALPEGEEIWSPVVTVHCIYNELRQLKVGKAPGSDGLPPRLLKAGAEILAPILTHLICLSVETKRMPLLWKIANIVPVPKKKAPTIKDIRPISLLPIFGKIAEKVLLSSVKESLTNLFGPVQYGFRPNSSTTFAHIRLHDFITSQLESTSVAGVILISFDMRKAFDCLDHKALLQTLAHSCLPTGFVRWCLDYLHFRKQRVVIENVASSLVGITSGVPQGSIISPSLFCLQMRSAKAFHPEALTIKYADDVLLGIPIYNYSEIDSTINNEIKNMEKWCKEHGLQLSVEKTKSMIITKKTSEFVSYAHQNSVEEMKTLGLVYNTGCNWNSHISSIGKSASRMVYILRMMKPFLPKPLLTRVYCAVIRSRLEYCNPVFVGLSSGNAEKLEKIQRRCHRIICGPHCSCKDFPPLVSRRTNMALRTFQQIKHPLHILHDLYPPLLPHGKRLMLSHSKTERRSQSFIPFCSRILNTM